MQKNTVILFDIDHTLFNTEEYISSNMSNFTLHPEVLEILQQVNKYAEIGIFSEGDISLQELKLLKTKINQLFKNDYIHIVEKKSDSMKDVINKYLDKKLFFVDDRLDILHAAKLQNEKVFTVWVKRGYYADKQEEIKNFTPDATVLDLLQAARIIKDNIV